MYALQPCLYIYYTYKSICNMQKQSSYMHNYASSHAAFAGRKEGFETSSSTITIILDRGVASDLK